MDSDTAGKEEDHTKYVGGNLSCCYNGSGLIKVTSYPNLLYSCVSMVSQGIIEVLANKPFQINVENLSKNPIYLPKRMYVGLGVEVPNRIVTFSWEPEESVNSIPSYKERENYETKLKKHRDDTN